MKKQITLTLVLSVSCILCGVAQQKNVLASTAPLYTHREAPEREASAPLRTTLSTPAAKNASPAQYATPTKQIMVTHRQQLSSPQAKNSRPGTLYAAAAPMAYTIRRDVKDPRKKH